jgi:hypothetical protein
MCHDVRQIKMTKQLDHTARKGISHDGGVSLEDAHHNIARGILINDMHESVGHCQIVNQLIGYLKVPTGQRVVHIVTGRLGHHIVEVKDIPDYKGCRIHHSVIEHGVDHADLVSMHHAEKRRCGPQKLQEPSHVSPSNADHDSVAKMHQLCFGDAVEQGREILVESSGAGKQREDHLQSIERDLVEELSLK